MNNRLVATFQAVVISWKVSCHPQERWLTNRTMMTAGRFAILTARTISRSTSLLLWRGKWRIPTIFGIMSPVFRYSTRISENNRQIAPKNHCKLQKKQDPWRSLSKTESNIIMFVFLILKSMLKSKKCKKIQSTVYKTRYSQSTWKNQSFFPYMKSRNWNIQFM